MNNNAVLLNAGGEQAGCSSGAGMKESEQFQFEKFAEFMEQRGLMLVSPKQGSGNKATAVKHTGGGKNKVGQRTNVENIVCGMNTVFKDDTHSVQTIYKIAVLPAKTKEAVPHQRRLQHWIPVMKWIELMLIHCDYH